VALGGTLNLLMNHRSARESRPGDIDLPNTRH